MAPSTVPVLDPFTTTSSLEAGEVKLVTSSFEKNILIYQACQALGIVSHQTKPLFTALCAEISTYLLAEELSLLVKSVCPCDPLFKHLANDLCHRRFKKDIPDFAAFEKWLGNRKMLQGMMMEIDRAHNKRRQASGAKSVEAKASV